VSAIAPDGSPVALYTRLGTGGEPELIDAAAPAGGEILELGCGAGRVTHQLVARGRHVVAVDNSPEMLRHVRGAEAVLADIETLRVGRRFAAVVLASHFVNESDDERRRRFLATCARHVLPDGVVLIERYPPDWQPEPTRAWREQGSVRIRLREATRRGAVVDAVMEYDVDSRIFSQAFTCRILSDAELDAELAAVGLRRVRVLGERATWVEAIIGS
jgi:SAM-dependent methyltransferase